MGIVRRIVLVATVTVLFSAAGAQQNPTLSGTWTHDPDTGTDLATWRARKPLLEIRTHDDTVVIETVWRRGRDVWRESLVVRPDGHPTTDTVESPIWMTNWFMGVLANVGDEAVTEATWLEPGRRLETETTQTVEVSQGTAVLVTTRVYALDPGGDVLTVTETRSSRPTSITMVFTRAQEAADE